MTYKPLKNAAVTACAQTLDAFIDTARRSLEWSKKL
jgi:hypothetical protein